VAEEDNYNIKIFDADDKSLKTLGELLSNDTSRKIIKILIEKEMYTNEIATELDIRVSLVIHHLKKLEELGIVEITHKQIVRKGNHHRYFKISKRFFIAPDMNKQEIKKTGILERIFKNTVKLSAVAFSGFITWIASQSVKLSAEATEEEKEIPHIDIWFPEDFPHLFSGHFIFEVILTGTVVSLVAALLFFFKFKKLNLN